MYVCNKCGCTSRMKMYSCPKCGSLDIEQKEVETKKVSYRGKTTTETSYSTGFNKNSISTVESTETKEDKVIAVYNQFPNFNKCLSSKGGLIEGAIVLLAASPGTGKTTLLTQCSNESTLFISSEETKNQVVNRFNRVGGCPNTQILCTTSPDDVLGAIETTDANIVFIDSINSLENELGGLASYQTIADLTQRIVHLGKKLNKSIIIISQVTKSGNVIGMESVSHAVDTIIHMERSTTSDTILLTTSKNRFGDVGDIVYLQHAEDGLHETEGLVAGENSIGTTIFEMVSGSKKVPVDVQCLIVCSNDNRPIRRTIGIETNKLYLLNGILQKNDNLFQTQDMDIYIQTSNGVWLPPGHDLAIINSMLSAFYNKVVFEDTYNLFNGILNLNGTIVGNPRFKHVKDIIQMYK